MPASLTKNIVITLVCLMVLIPGLVLIHTALPAFLSHRIHATGFTGQLHVFWDARPYAQGINSYNSGQNPYPLDDAANILPFAYPPVFLWVAAPLARLLTPEVGWRAYTVVNLACVVLVQLILSAMFLRRLGRRVLLLLLFVPISLFATTVFWSGNIHLVWYAAAMLAAFPGIRRNQWLPFYATALLASVNQPVFALMLLLPVFGGRGQYLYSAVTVVLTGAVYVAERALHPALYAAFQMSVKQHLQASHDFGHGFFGICATLAAPRLPFAVPLAMGLQLIFSAAIFLLLLYLKPKERGDSPSWLGLIAIAIVLVNPRIMMYDAAIGIIPACYFLVAGIRFRMTGPQITRWVLLILTVSLSVAAHQLLEFSLLLLAGFVAGVADERERLRIATDTEELFAHESAMGHEAAVSLP